eukprot:8498758-Karenia_brevis.AAC.1
MVMGSGGSPLAFQFLIIVACAISMALPSNALFGTGPIGRKDGNIGWVVCCCWWKRGPSCDYLPCGMVISSWILGCACPSQSAPCGMPVGWVNLRGIPHPLHH